MAIAALLVTTSTITAHIQESWFDSSFFVVVVETSARLTKKGTMFYFHLGLSSHNRIERIFGILRMTGIIPLPIVVTIKRFAFARFVVLGVFYANVTHSIFST